MTVSFYGPLISIHFDANDLPNNSTVIQLPGGYSYERIFINDLLNINGLTEYMSIHIGDHITFPVVNGKSPSRIYLHISDISKPSDIKIAIEKFGQIPDTHYFDNTFRPILITDEDGNKYNVIPSDQFK